MVDMINHPPHYASHEIFEGECIEWIWNQPKVVSDMGKYAWRFDNKDTPESNIGKVRFYARLLRDKAIHDGYIPRVNADDTARTYDEAYAQYASWYVHITCDPSGISYYPPMPVQHTVGFVDTAFTTTTVFDSADDDIARLTGAIIVLALQCSQVSDAEAVAAIAGHIIDICNRLLVLFEIKRDQQK